MSLCENAVVPPPPGLLPGTAAERMLWIDYSDQPIQTPAALLSRERRRRGRPLADRIKRLRLLNAPTCRSVQGAAPMQGSSERQLPRRWGTYATGGIEVRGPRPVQRGRQAPVGEDAGTALAAEMPAGRVAHRNDAPALPA
jgi:hypothetical protein